MSDIVQTRLRIARPVDDAAAVAAIYAPYVLETAISFEETPPSDAEMACRIEATLGAHPFLVFEEAGRVIGFAYGSPHLPRAAYRWSANVSVYVAADAHRRGVGRTLYESLLAMLRRQGFHSLYAGIAFTRTASPSTRPWASPTSGPIERSVSSSAVGTTSAGGGSLWRTDRPRPSRSRSRAWSPQSTATSASGAPTLRLWLHPIGLA
jgi:L-amino acid N-acyltransferase YncA